MTDPDPGFPDRIGIGDGPMQACRFVSIDMASDGADTIVTGRRDESGVIHLDREETDVPFFFANYSDYPLPPAAPPPDLLATITAQANDLQRAFAAIGAALAPLAEQAHRAMAAVGRATRLGTVAVLEDAGDADWPAQGATCAHVCGPDPSHTCDARATASVTHPLPSGGKRTLPLCGPCHAAETTEVARA